MPVRISLVACAIALLATPAAAQSAAPMTVTELFAQGYEIKAAALTDLLIMQKSGKVYLCRVQPASGDVAQIAKAFGKTACAPI